MKLAPLMIQANTAETMTVQFERPLEDMVDFELPGLIDNVEGDFEAVVKEGDFSSTMVFNEEIFKDDDSINPFDEDTKTSTTLSTEAIEADAETRVSEIMVDEDGLKASDFGLNDEDFPAEKEDNKYYESEAGIQTPTLNLSTQELEELGFADDDKNQLIAGFFMTIRKISSTKLFIFSINSLNVSPTFG